MSTEDLFDTEFDRQLDTLVALGYPALMGLQAQGFRALAGPLRPLLREQVSGAPAPRHEVAPFVLVVSGAQVPASQRISLVTWGGRPGVLSPHFADADTFRPTVELPAAALYALLRVERGEEFCGVRPAEAAQVLAGRGRTLLTIEEGLCFLHASPASLEKNKCFHTGASRGTDRRVPALWISQKAPVLGWCWEQNHHTWLGVASAESRLAVEGGSAL